VRRGKGGSLVEIANRIKKERTSGQRGRGRSAGNGKDVDRSGKEPQKDVPQSKGK